jgi:AAA family ATP:ADP antiporter
MAWGTERLDRVLDEILRLRRQELKPALLMFSFCLCAVGAVIVARSVRDTLFLAHVSAGELPSMYIWASATLSVASLLYARVAERFRRDWMVAFTPALMGLSIVAARFALDSGEWIYYALYVWVEVIGSLTMIQFWTLASDLYTAREAKRLFGLIAAGGTVANVVAGFAVSGLAPSIGAENLLFLSGGLFAAAAALGLITGRVLAARLRGRVRDRQRRTTAAQGAPVGPLVTPHLRSVGAIVFFTFLTTTFVDYQFKALAAGTFGQDVEGMAQYFGAFFAITGCLALFVQFGMTGRLLEKLGVVPALLILPLALGGGSAFLILQPVLWAATLAKGADMVLRYTVNDATLQLLYLPVPPAARARAKAFIDGLLKPATMALAGALLVVYREWALSVSPLSMFALVLVGLWGATVLRLRSEYVQSLRDTLSRRRLALGSASQRLGGDAARVLRAALGSSTEREVVNALELADRVNENLAAAVAPLLGHGSPRVRRLACDYLARSGATEHANNVFLCFEDPDTEVQAAAIQAYCALGKERAAQSVRPYLDSPDAPVKAAAVVSTMRYGGLDGVVNAAHALKGLLTHAHPSQRAQGARVLGEIGVANFYQSLIDLLGDSDLEVRRAAIRASTRIRTPELVPTLLERLGERETSREAAHALAAQGASIEPVIAGVLRNPQAPLEMRRHAPRVLARLASPEALASLANHVDDAEEGVRRAAIQSLARVTRHNPDAQIDRRKVASATMLEVGRCYQALAAAEGLGLAESPADKAATLLSSALREKVDRILERVFLLLGILHPRAELELVQSNLRDPSPAARANAVEILDNILSRPLKRRLLPLLDDTPRQRKLRDGGKLFHLPQLPAEAWVGELICDENGWVVACTAHYAASRPGASALGTLVVPSGSPPAVRRAALLEHPFPLVRETVLAALEKLLPPEELLPIAAAAKQDDFPPIRARARAIATRLSRPRQAAGP